MEKKSEPPVRILAELSSAGFMRIGVVVFAVFAAYVAILIIGLLCPPGWWTNEHAGQFGDAFGMFTSLFNALAFAALVATVVLQSKDLRDQAALTRQLEDDRIRPFIKAEWHEVPTQSATTVTFEYALRNVGLGVAIVESIDLYSGNDFVTALTSHDLPNASDGWQTALTNALKGAFVVRDKHLFQFNDLNRALAPMEHQAVIRIVVNTVKKTEVAHLLRAHFEPIIRFKSVRGAKADTKTQFEAIRGL
jgi:hypothetical protein